MADDSSTVTEDEAAGPTGLPPLSPAAGASRFHEVNLIADPLYGYIELTKGEGAEYSERTLLDSPWLQRLRRVHQMQSAWWIFPSAEHSRFVHLLGAMHLSSLFARRVDASLRASFPDTPSPACVEETLRLAGLLHDVGHGPFSHFFDQAYLSQWGLDHEVIGRHLIQNQLADIIAGLRSSPSGRFEPGESVDPRWVAWLMADPDIEGYTPPTWVRAIKPILCGPATVDNLDYVPRDAYMCGVSIGPVDVQRIVHYSFIHDGTIVLHSNAMGALEMFLQSRLFMYIQVYLHRTSRRFDLSMQEIFADTVDKLIAGNPLEHMDQYLELDDWTVLESVKRWRHDPAGTDTHALAEAWYRILNRDLTWHLAYETVVHHDTDVAAIEQRVRQAAASVLRGARIHIDIATARIAPNNPMTEDGMVAIYEPLQDRVEHTRTAELVARLPQYNQMIRVFTDHPRRAAALHRVAQRAIHGSSSAGNPAAG